MNDTKLAIAPEGQVFPRFAFRSLTPETIAVTHHWTSQGLLRKRTDNLSAELAGQLITTLRGLGYKPTEYLA